MGKLSHNLKVIYGKMTFLNYEDNFLSMQNYNVIDVKSGNEVQLKNI